MLFLDLDHFKVINDSLGHAAGDELLVAVAARLRGAVRPADTVARFGGDEFVVLCEDLGRRARAPSCSPSASRRLHHAVRPRRRGHVVRRQHVGIAVSRRAATSTPEDLMRDADAAMYRAKERGRGRFEVFDDADRARALERLKTETSCGGPSSRASSCVALPAHLRLADGASSASRPSCGGSTPSGGCSRPGEFIPVAEETGLIVPHRQLGDAAGLPRRQPLARRRLGGAAVRLTVNLSPRQLAAGPGRASSPSCSTTSGSTRPRLGLEITESVPHGRGRRGQSRPSTALRELGVRPRASTTSAPATRRSPTCKRFPLDVLKIDRSFVAGLDRATAASHRGGRRRHGRGPRATVIAEGMETEAQLAKLTDLGCGFGQGFLFSRPVESSEIERMLAAGMAVA